MNRLIKMVLILIYSFAISLPVLADMVSRSSSCSKPFRPSKITTQSEMDKFNRNVNTYKKCITDFVDEQQEAAKRHQKSASDAISKWNKYVNTEYNQ